MPRCYACGAEIPVPFECSFCGGVFCFEHRLQENHNCPVASARSPIAPRESKSLLLMELPDIEEVTVTRAETSSGEKSSKEISEKRTKGEDGKLGVIVATCEGKYRFSVPFEVCTDREYREKLSEAKTSDEVERVIRDFYEYHKKRKSDKEPIQSEPHDP